MKPLPWSHSALDQFKNCPRSYHAHRVEKSVVETKGPQTLDGERTHKAFEDRLKHGVVLTPDLEMHEELLHHLEQLPGQQYVETDAALNRQAQACGYWDADVWYRGKIDYLKVDGAKARVIDWKTGKAHQKLLQLYEYMLWTFIKFPGVESCRAEFYWTKTQSLWGVTFGRERVPEIWAMLVPDLKQFAEAFRTDTWQPRQSGLCKRHCAVVSCEFNGAHAK